MKKGILLFITALLFVTGCSSEPIGQDEIVMTEEEIQEHHQIIITSSSPEIKLKNIEITEGDGFKDSDCIENVPENSKYTVVGNVNNSKPGTYKLRYTVTDDYGNITSQTATVTVKEKPAPAPQPEVVYTPPQQTYTYQQPVYQQPTYTAPSYTEPSYSSGGASGSSSADATGGSGSVGGMSWDACVAEVARRHSGSCVQIVGTNTYYVLD